MRNEGQFAILVGGSDVTLRMKDIVQSISVSDRAGTSSDMAVIVLDDSAGNIIWPTYDEPCIILLGTRGGGISIAFTGTVDEVRHSGGRGGSAIEIVAKGIDTSGKTKEPQQRHFDDMTIEEILQAAGATAGVTDVRVDTELGAIEREYEHMDDESFIAFGQRLAGEIGGTFKVRNNIAVMAKRNAARSPLGSPLPSVIAARGDNLIEWSVAPYIGRPRYSQIRVRYYDTATAKYEEIVIETGIVGGDATAVGRFRARNKAAAEDKANAIRANCERGSGMGSVTIEGNVGAQAEATCAIVGARIGVDGLYVIDGGDHRYTRAGGCVTTLQLAYPA